MLWVFDAIINVAKRLVSSRIGWGCLLFLFGVVFWLTANSRHPTEERSFSRSIASPSAVLGFSAGRPPALSPSLTLWDESDPAEPGREGQKPPAGGSVTPTPSLSAINDTPAVTTTPAPVTTVTPTVTPEASSSSQEQEKINTQVERLSQYFSTGDYKSFYQMTSAEFRQSFSLSEFEESFTADPSVVLFESLGSPVVEGDWAEVLVRMVLLGGTEELFKAIFHWEEGGVDPFWDTVFYPIVDRGG